MREISVRQLSDAVRELYLTANYRIGPDVAAAVEGAGETEASPTGRSVLRQLQENYRIAREESVAICQDTGMAILFLEVGQEVHFVDGDFEEAVQDGVRRAYRD
ncbi:MAG: fumarate hydratase, partial [Prevotella sp.]|nr:fumarate hydratase [Prevotella sp.]